MGEFCFTRGESKEKILQEGKTKLVHITGGYQPIYPTIFIHIFNTEK
jgi:hypothetical protein